MIRIDTFAAMAVLNGLIAAAYYTIAGYLAPRLTLPKPGRYAGVAFFVACGLTHTELAVHGLQFRPAWLVSTHMFGIHGAQAVLDWGFIVVAVRYLDMNFARKPSRAARRLSEGARGALANWEWTPRSDRVRCSGAYARIAGRDASDWELSFDEFLAHVHPEDRATLAYTLKDAVACGAGGGVIDYRLLPGDKGPRAVEARWELVRNRRGGVRVVGVVRDVTEEWLAAESRAQVIRAEAKQAEAEALAERRRRVQELSDAALKRNDLGRLLDALVGWLARTLAVDTAAVVLRDDAQDAFAVAAVHEPDSVAKTEPVLWGPAFAARVATNGRLVVLDEIDAHSLDDLALGAPQPRVLVGAPLWIERDVIGVVQVGSLQSRAFRDDELELLQLAAERMALAIHQTRLFEREHEIAATLQRSLLPEALPEISGLDLAARYVPAAAGSQVGGDWYDVIELPDGDVVMVMGDVVGKGIRAAALVGKLRYALRAYALEGHQPQQVVERLNGLVDVHSHEMATLLYMACRPATGEVRWVSAGHLPPLIRHADGQRAFLDGAQSLPLGAAPIASFGLAHATLEPGDTVLLYTDGLVERRRVGLDNGLERLQSAAIGDGTPNNLCDTALRVLLPDSKAADDVALLAVHLRGDCQMLDLHLPARPDSLAAMRRALRRWMARGRIDGVLADSILIATGEACANAIKHAYGPGAASFHLEASRHRDTIEVTVHDSGHWRERRSTDGRGLLIMRMIASSLDVIPADDGTIVRLTFEARD